MAVVQLWSTATSEQYDDVVKEIEALGVTVIDNPWANVTSVPAFFAALDDCDVDLLWADPNVRSITYNATIDNILCSSETCSDVSCSGPRLRGATPADVMPATYDVTQLFAGPDFSAPADFILGLNEWWIEAKTVDWWLGSNHGIDSITGAEIASSLYTGFDQFPNENLITGAGPVWGCTIVSVVSNTGAWTAHFWEGFFGNDALFQDKVLNFLYQGNPAEQYPGLAALAGNGQPFNNAGNTFLSVIIMTPEDFIQVVDPILNGPPTIIQLVGEKYPARVQQIQQVLNNIFGFDIGSQVVTYASDQAIWSWQQPDFTGNTMNWGWRLDRSIRRQDQPWLGMLTIQRRPTSSPDIFPPAVRIYTENVLHLEIPI